MNEDQVFEAKHRRLDLKHKNLLINWLIDWLIDWLTDWLPAPVFKICVSIDVFVEPIVRGQVGDVYSFTWIRDFLLNPLALYNW